jgi:acetate kinase
LDLSQPGQFAAMEMVNLVGPKGRIEKVRILGPLRRESQVEISRTEQFKLGVDAPIRDSGDIEGTPGVTLEGPVGSVKIEKGLIAAKRHIHMSPEEALGLGLRDRDTVMVRVKGVRELIFGDVLVRVNPAFRMDMHLDTDEANAAQIAPGMVGYIEAIQHRNYV